MVIGICDDDAIARNKIHKFCKELLPKYCLNYEIKEFENGEQLKGSKLDILLLDVEMPKLDGIQVKQLLFETEKNQLKRTIIIFITEHEEYMQGSYDLNVAGFVTKSRMKEQLPTILKFAIERSGTGSMIDGWNIDDIMFIEAGNGYSILDKYDANHFLYKKSLKEMDALLLNVGFVKIGKSALVNMRYIKKIENRKIIWNGFEPQNDIDGIYAEKRMDSLTVSVRLESSVKKCFDSYCRANARYC